MAKVELRAADRRVAKVLNRDYRKRGERWTSEVNRNRNKASLQIVVEDRLKLVVGTEDNLFAPLFQSILK